jgi:hypothetical protein
MQKLTFTFTQDQANKILWALSKQPYEAVADLVQYMQQQAAPQLAPAQQALAEKAE